MQLSICVNLGSRQDIIVDNSIAQKNDVSYVGNHKDDNNSSNHLHDVAPGLGIPSDSLVEDTKVEEISKRCFRKIWERDPRKMYESG